jgi:hypothetical protein
MFMSTSNTNTVQSSPGITWEEPPSTHARRGRPQRWAPILENFRKLPGQWGRLNDLQPAQTPYQIRSGGLGGALKGEFDAVGHKPEVEHPKKYVEVWVRYIGTTNDEN